MPMKSVSGKKLCKVLENHGWRLLRINGSHHIYGRPGAVERLAVPVHANQDLKRGLLMHLLRQAGLTEDEV